MRDINFQFPISNFKFQILWLVLIILVHVFLLSKLIFFPYPELFVYPYLTENGLLPYKQIFDQHFPGLFFLPVNLNNLGLVDQEIARIWLFCIVGLTHLLIFLTGLKIFQRKSWVLVANILYLVWQPFFAGWSLWIDSFLPIILLTAFLLTYDFFQAEKKNTRFIFLVGLLIGFGVVFKQVLVPLGALLGIYFIWKKCSLREILAYSIGILIPITGMIVYLVSIGVWLDFWYWTVVYNLTVYSEYGRKAAPAIGFLTRVGLVFGTSVLLLFSRGMLVKEVLFIFLFGGLICVYGRFDFIYFQTALPFAILATVYGASFLTRNRLIQVLVVAYILISVWWLKTFYQGHLGTQVLSFDKQTVETAAKIEQYTIPRDKIFILGAPPHLYQMTHTLPAGDLFVFQFPWFYLVVEDRILAGIIKDQPRIVVIDNEASIEESRVSEFAPRIYNYLMENYYQIDRVGTAGIMQKKDEK